MELEGDPEQAATGFSFLGAVDQVPPSLFEDATVPSGTFLDFILYFGIIVD